MARSRWRVVRPLPLAVRCAVDVVTARLLNQVPDASDTLLSAVPGRANAGPPAPQHYLGQAGGLGNFVHLEAQGQGLLNRFFQVWVVPHGTVTHGLIFAHFGLLPRKRWY